MVLMFALFFAVLHLFPTSDAHEVVPTVCVRDPVVMLQQGGVEVRSSQVLHHSVQALASDNNDDLADENARKHNLHGALLANATGVPDIIYMTGPYMPEDLVKSNLAFVNWGTEFRYFDNDQMEVSTKEISDKLRKIGLSGAYETFRTLRPMAFRADLWRLMVLWDTGGYYLDAKMVLRVHISKFVDRNNDGAFAACLEDMKSRMWGGRTAYWSGVLAARPHDQLVLEMIRLIIKNVATRTYGTELPGSVLQITGPGVLTRTMENANFTPHVRCQFEHVDGDNKRARVVANTGEVLLDAVEAVHSDMKGCSECSYNKLYPAHAVFCDEPTKVPTKDDPCRKKPLESVTGEKYWSKIVNDVAEQQFLTPFGH